MTNNRGEMPPEVIAALGRGHKIEAIKLLRESRGLGLKEAKEAVEAHVREQPDLQRSRSVVGASRHGLLFWLVLIVLLGLLILFSQRL